MIEIKPEPMDCEESIKEPEIFKKDSSKVHGQNSKVKCEPIICKENIQEPEVFEEDSFKGLKRLTGSVQEDKKPFKCKICDGSFERNYQLKVHRDSVHERKKPFICTICDACFSEKGNLKRHTYVINS